MINFLGNACHARWSLTVTTVMIADALVVTMVNHLHLRVNADVIILVWTMIKILHCFIYFLLAHLFINLVILTIIINNIDLIRHALPCDAPKCAKNNRISKHS